MEAIEILRNKLVGSFISRFSVGDTWDFYIDGYWLIAQNILSKDEYFMNSFLETNYQSLQSTVDKQYISKCAIVAAAMRREIISVKLTETCGLEIDFEDGFNLFIPTDEDIVDWQWCLSNTNTDPYLDYIVACFWAGKIEVNKS